MATYSACGSSDPSQSEQDAGAGGEAQAGEGAGGSQSAAGSRNDGGSSAGTTANEGGVGGAALGGGGGGGDEPLGGAAGAAGSAGTTGDAGAAGAGGAPDSGLPSACPGVITDYTQLDGGPEADTFDTTELENKKLAFGLDGPDVFEKNHDGGDCLVGGPGDDELTNPSESASYLIGGEGADVFHLDQLANNYARIVDMTSEDEIGLSKTAYSFLAGQVGAAPYDSQVYSIADYEAGTGSVPSNEGAAIVYDPGTGGLWIDTDRGTKGGTETQIGTIVNHAGYTYDINDFVLED